MNSKDIFHAFEEYDNGRRPKNYRNAKYVWVINPSNDRLYPLKIIWALAKNSATRDVNTRDIARKLKALGFNAIDIRTDSVYPNAKFNNEFDKKVRKALQESPEKRQEKLKSRKTTKPSYSLVEVRQFDRNPYVVAEVLIRANGFCEKCKQKAPFIKKSNLQPYLEVHHIIPLSENGDDTVENCLALCPNCHRKEHYG